MNEVTKIITFASAHRLLEHEEKCRFLHGHNYKAHITISGDIDRLGRVIDFSDLKKKSKDWIDKNWDHNILLNEKDPLTQIVIEFAQDGKPYLFKGNPTAEIMARELFYIVKDLFPYLKIDSVIIYETETSYARYTESK